MYYCVFCYERLREAADGWVRRQPEHLHAPIREACEAAHGSGGSTLRQALNRLRRNAARLLRSSQADERELGEVIEAGLSEPHSGARDLLQFLVEQHRLVQHPCSSGQRRRLRNLGDDREPANAAEALGWLADALEECRRDLELLTDAEGGTHDVRQ